MRVGRPSTWRNRALWHGARDGWIAARIVAADARMSAIARLAGLFSTLERRVESKIDHVNNAVGAIMRTLEDLVTVLDTITAQIAARFDRLEEANAAFAAQVTRLEAELAAEIAADQSPNLETLAALEAVSDRLTALSADPAPPAPAPVESPSETLAP